MKKLRTTSIGLFPVLLIVFPLFVTSLPAQVDRGAAVPGGVLPRSLRGLEIKDYFVPSSSKKVGVIQALRGHVVVIHLGTMETYFGRPGDTIYEKDSLNTLAGSRCRIRFFDEDLVNMGEDTEFSVESFQDQRKKRRKRSFFSMLKGKVRFYAFRLFNYRERNIRLKTPTAVVGVRGTKFGVHVYRIEDQKSSQAGITVADSGRGIAIYLAKADPGGGGKTYTDCHSEDGFIEVEDEEGKKVVGPGEMYKGETGDVMPTPDEYVDQFNKDTDVKEKEKKPEEEIPMGGTKDPDEKKISDIIDTQTDTTQQETGKKIEQIEPTKPEPPEPPLEGPAYDAW
ncbi:MAG: FecR family protein [Desulfobacteraceae bacterium]|jgi:hypothetical protein